MTFDPPGLFSTSDLKSSERLAMFELEQSLALAFLDGDDLPTTPGGTPVLEVWEFPLARVEWIAASCAINAFP